ncbi:flagellar hook-length control protein FliK [Pseudoxanthomonas winnipegensis]|uniref:flagellar hook-length control protein FliK n=1 Tax=Pseudoxanthomonas winnipegensis TaxID=2480810 RepID=UPI002574A609|nr:flagellar hook-length control protein FliK [Pseudoxanthomonas winnipegensis]WJI16398.1 flagellar hook-length control protein FliK [Pseudoxanthomonas winnipegensis]
MIAGGAAFLSGAGLASPGASASPAASAATAGDGRSYADFAASAATAATGSATPAAGASAAAQSATANATSSQPANPSAAAAPAAGSATPPAGGSDTMQPNPANATLPLPAANVGTAVLAAAAHQIRRGADPEAAIPDATQSMQAALTPQMADSIAAPLTTSATASKDDIQAAPVPSSDPQQLLALLAGSLAITAPVTPAANAPTLPAADVSVTGAARAVNPALLAGNAVGANAASTAATPAAATAPASTGDAQPSLATGVAFTAPAQPLTDAATLPTADGSATSATKGATAALIAGNAAGALQQSPGLVSTGALAALLDPKAAATAAPADALKLAVGAALEREGANGFALPDSKDDRSDALSFGGLVQGTPSLDRPLTANAVTATPMSMPAQLDDGFDDSFGTRIAWMAEQKLGHAEIRLNPEHAGPIDVRIQLDGTQVNAAFHSANADVRQALEASLPRLRDLLGQQGLQLGNADIGQRQQSGQQQDQGAAPRSQGQSFGSDAFGNGRATAQASVAPVVVRSRGLLDEYA